MLSDLWHQIADSLSAALLALSAEWEVLGVNAAAENLLGVSRISPLFLNRLLRHNEWLGTMVGKCLESGRTLDNPEVMLRLRGRETMVRAEVAPLIEPNGLSYGVVVLMHDLAHQKNAEQSLREEDNLKLSSAGLAHEVKNPLAGIKGAAELLAAMSPRDSRAQQYCSLILDGVDRISSLVEQVLAISGPHRLKRERINVHQVLHQALRMAGAYPLVPPGLEVEQIFDPSLPEIVGDASALERVFLNLIRNGLEAIGARPILEPASQNEPDGPGAATASPRHKLRLRTSIETQFRMTTQGRRLQFLRVEVSDSGIGMAPDELKQLFTPFFTTKSGGTGLGLVLSRRIIALHGGKLWAQSGVGEPATGPGSSKSAQRPAGGMTFHVILPINPPQESAAV